MIQYALLSYLVFVIYMWLTYSRHGDDDKIRRCPTRDGAYLDWWLGGNRPSFVPICNGIEQWDWWLYLGGVDCCYRLVWAPTSCRRLQRCRRLLDIGRLNFLFVYPGVWDLGIEREILRIETFSNRGGVSVTVLDLRIENFSNRDSVSILVFDLRIETFSN